MKKVIIIFFTWVLVINIFALLSNNRVNLKPDTAYSWIVPEYTFQVQTWDVLSLHNRWDSFWFLDIVKNGYSYKEGQLSNIPFFPLYPSTVGLTSFLLHLNPLFVGWVITLTTSLLACIFLYKLVKTYHKDADPIQSVILLLIFPTAIFLNSIFSESMFLLFSILVFYYTLKKNFLLASIFGFFAALTRFTGILLFVPVVIEYILTYKKNALNIKSLQLLLIPLGTFLFFLFHKIAFGDFFLYLKVQALWGRDFFNNISNFYFGTNPAIVNFIFDVSFLIFGVIASIYVIKKVRLSYGIYMLLSILVATGSGSLMSIGRYVLTLFPVFILGGMIKDKYKQQLWIILSVLLAGLYTLLFISHYWAG